MPRVLTGDAVPARLSYRLEKRLGATGGLHLPGRTARGRREGPGPSPNANEPRGQGWRLRGGALVAHFPPREEGGAWRSGRGRCFCHRAPLPRLARRLLGGAGRGSGWRRRSSSSSSRRRRRPGERWLLPRLRRGARGCPVPPGCRWWEALPPLGAGSGRGGGRAPQRSRSFPPPTMCGVGRQGRARLRGERVQRPARPGGAGGLPGRGPGRG